MKVSGLRMPPKGQVPWKALLLACVLPTACGPDGLTDPAQRRLEISVASGGGQIAGANQDLPEPIIVRVQDRDGAPVEGIRVSFYPFEGGGDVAPTHAQTDEDGYAATRWTIGDGLFQTLEVALAEGRFKATPIQVPATIDRWVHLAVLSGDEQAGMSGEELPAPVAFKLTDSYGNPMQGIDVFFRITAGGGQLNQEAVRTNEEGVAEVMSTLGTGFYQRIRASIQDPYWFSRYAFAKISAEPAPSTIDGRWITGIEYRDGQGQAIPHDGRVFESARFLTFSDGSSDEVKRRYAAMAEESLQELLAVFELRAAEDLGIYSDRPDTKIRIFCSKELEVRMQAFPFGVVLYDENHPVWRWSWDPTHQENYRNTVKHELMHVVQFYLGAGTRGPWPEDWFVDGIAEYISGGAFYHIDRWSQVEAWMADSRHLNPITIRLLARDIPSGVDAGTYYPMFGLAVEYLMDEKGGGKTPLDVKAMLQEMGNGKDFRSAFAAHMGISVNHFRENFYDLIADFLAVY